MSSHEPPPSGKALLALEVVTFGVGIVLFVLFGWVLVARFAYPIDAEWMTGAVRDTVTRVRDGQALYAKPSEQFISFLYPPLYYWLAGTLAHVCSVFVACKVVSILATVGTAAGIASLARTLGATRRWTALALLLHFGTYGTTLFFYDLERVDVLGVSVVVVGLALLLRSDEVRATTVFGGGLLGLSFYGKQPGLLVFLAVVSALAFAGRTKQAKVCGATGALLWIVVGGWLELRTGPWFRYYCVSLPSAHGIDTRLLSTFFVQDLPKVVAFSMATLFVVGRGAARVVRRDPGESWRELVFAAALAAGVGGAFLLRTHSGGWPNVLLSWTPLACVAVATSSTRIESLARDTGVELVARGMLLACVCLQFLGSVFDPNEVAPTRASLYRWQLLRANVRDLESGGEVLVTTTGDLTKEPHLHLAALFDVLRAGDSAPPEFLAKVRERRYTALVIGELDELDCGSPGCTETQNAIRRNYFVAGELPWPKRGLPGHIGFPSVPRWILRPRQTPLGELSTESLAERQRAEANLAAGLRLPEYTRELTKPHDELEALAARPL